MESGDETSSSDNVERSELGRCLRAETVNNRVAIADGDGITQGKEVCHLKNKDVNNSVAMADGFGIIEGQSGRGKYFRTYKRRRHAKMSCPLNKVQDDSRKCVEPTSLLSDQAVKNPCDLAVGKTSKDYLNGHWRNVALQCLYRSFDNDNSGIGCCIREAIMKNSKTTTDTIKWFSHKLQSNSNKHADIMHDGCSSESDGHDVTKKCQRVICNILASEEFSSLCMVLFENFQGMKPESVFDLSVINSRMKEQEYELSPTLFLSDIEQVWRKLQDVGNEIFAIAKSLSSMSSASYCEHVGVSAHKSFEDEKQVICNQALDSDTKPQPTEECLTTKFCTCRHCGGSSHDNCVVCERLNVPKSLNNTGGEESTPTDDETPNELQENSNGTFDGIRVSIAGRNSPNCKICGEGIGGEKFKECDNIDCPYKYYHVRCLSSKELKTPIHYSHYWYCPSCLCRGCLKNKEDYKIVLCDGCDHAYHFYCMEPPRKSMPRGKTWFCRKCDAGIKAIRLAKKIYANDKRRARDNFSRSNGALGKKRQQVEELDRAGGMDMLLTAANTLNFEENLASGQIESQRI